MISRGPYIRAVKQPTALSLCPKSFQRNKFKIIQIEGIVSTSE